MAGKDSVPGYRFRPTDVELVQYFLKRKVRGKKIPSDVITELDLYKYAPWDLPDLSPLKTGDLEWYFFYSRVKKYSTGGRVNRATEAGYWKTTGKDREIEHMNRVVGMIKTLVFYTGKAHKGDRTDWVMHEFRLDDKELADKGVPQDSYVICRVFQKEGPGPRNGAQYGKPFKHEDWDTEEEIDSVQPAAVSAPAPIQPEMMPPCLSHLLAPKNQVDSVSCVLGLMPSCSAHPPRPNSQVDSLSCVSDLIPSCLVHPSSPNNQADDNILSLLECFEDVDTLAANENNRTENVDDFNQANNATQENNASCAPCLDPNTIFENLGDLDSLFGLGEGSSSCGQNNKYITNEMLYTGNIFEYFDPQYCLELMDLEKPQILPSKHGSGSQDM